MVEKNLQSSSHIASKKEKQSDDEVKEADKLVREENQVFYSKCLDYVYSIQEFEYDWFSYFSGNVITTRIAVKIKLSNYKHLIVWL
jgi:hypothetical protein